MADINLQDIKNNFIQELTKAQSGEKNSLAFIVNQIPQKPLIQEGEIFEVLTIGGSVCRKALVKKVGQGIENIKQEESSVKTFQTKLDLLDTIVDLLEDDVKVVAINFAYAVEPIFDDNKLDAILLRGSKEHRFDGLIGQRVGQSIEQYIQKKLNRNIQVSLANDTICLLLSGLAKYPWNSLAAGIVGTGYNFAFFLDQDKLVNLEAGNFDKFEQTAEGKEIDGSSNQSGNYKFEKEVAGAYLYKHFNSIIKSKGLNYPVINSSKELDQAALAEDLEIAAVAQLVINRAAGFVATMIAGLMEYTKRDLIFVMEGSLFWKGVGYKETVAAVVKQLAPDYKAEFIHIEDSTVLGGAKLVA